MTDRRTSFRPLSDSEEDRHEQAPPPGRNRASFVFITHPGETDAFMVVLAFIPVPVALGFGFSTFDCMHYPKTLRIGRQLAFDDAADPSTNPVERRGVAMYALVLVIAV